MQKKIIYIETRLGEPITALDIQNEYLVFGSISGYYGLLDLRGQNQPIFKKCRSELIRDIKIKNDKLYIAVGDIEILVTKIPNLDVIDHMEYKNYKHNDKLCSNILTYICESEDSNSLNCKLIYFPTKDSEKQSNIKRS